MNSRFDPELALPLLVVIGDSRSVFAEVVEVVDLSEPEAGDISSLLKSVWRGSSRRVGGVEGGVICWVIGEACSVSLKIEAVKLEIGNTSTSSP